MSTAGASILGVGLPAPDRLPGLVHALRQDQRRAIPGPPTGLEWQTTSPPPTENFAKTPIVDEEAYDYAHPPKEAVRCLTPTRARSRHHFATSSSRRTASTLGMWVFIAQEILFFGGLFAVLRGLPHAVLRAPSPRAATTSTWKLGAVNTVVLICSSFTMAMAVHVPRRSRSSRAIAWLVLATIVLGSVFLGVKDVEYQEKFEHHLGAGPALPLPGPPARDDAEATASRGLARATPSSTSRSTSP